MTEPWRVGRHVPHHVYRGDGNTVADEVAVTHRAEDAAQIVADHHRLTAVQAERDRYRAALARAAGSNCPCRSCEEARQVLAEDPDPAEGATDE